MQQEVLIVTHPAQARALQDVGFLGRFLNPASPSDVARELGISANLAHHHAKRHASLGLLQLVKRERGKVYYQLAARTFKHDRSLLPAGDPDEQTAVTMKLLADRFLENYERCDRAAAGENPNWHVYGFDRVQLPGEENPKRPANVGEAKPAHFQARTIRLSPSRYRELVRRIAWLLMEAEADDEPRGDPCTLAFLAFDGVVQEGSQDSHQLSTFVPPNEPGEEGKSWKF